MADPRDLKFFPTDERLVKHYLRKRIDTGRENFIKDIKLYEDEPWLLPHVNNNLFITNEWFYFVKRTCKSGNIPKRTVPGRGGSNGGTWTTTGKKMVILDRNKVVTGYKTELAYYKKVEGKTKADITGWLMTEYWLPSENDELFQEVVLCYIRGKKKKVNQVSSYLSSNRVFESLEDIISMVDPRDLKFFPTDLRLVDHYLRNKVKTGKEGFIKDIKLYEDEPWLLSHVKNDQFIEKQRFYFVKRTRGSGKRPKRTVPGRGGSEGGTWTSTGEKTKILDSNNIVIGYKLELSYYKHVKGKKKGDITGWCMTEYWLASENDDSFQEVVLCNIRVKKNLVDPVQSQTETNNNIVEQTPIDNNMVSNALVTGVGEFGQQNMENDEVLDLTHQQLMLPQESIPLLQGQDSRSTMDQHLEKFAGELENMLEVEEEESDECKAIPQQHPQPLPLQGQDSRSTMDQHMEAYEDELKDMLDEEEDGDDTSTQQQHPQIPLSSQCQDSGNPLVIMDHEWFNQDIIFNLIDLEDGRTPPQQQKIISAENFDELYFAGLNNMQKKLNSQEKYLARDQETSTQDNMMMTNNPYGCVFDTLGDKMQEPHVTNGVDVDLSNCSGATEEQSSKRRKQC